MLTDAAELDVQPDCLSNTPEGQHHTSFHVVPARTVALLDHHPNPSTYPPRGSLSTRPGDPTYRCGPTISVAGLRTIEAWRRLSISLRSDRRDLWAWPTRLFS